MARRSTASVFARAYQRNLRALTKVTLSNSKRIAGQVQRAAAKRLKPPPGKGDWLSGMAVGAGGARGYHLFRPADLQLAPGEKLPLMVMLHGCGQTGRDFAASTRMNALAVRQRFLVLYPEQDRLAHPQGCWNWYERRSGKADAEAATLMAAVDQACMLYPVDRDRVAVAGLSAGASMAALLATRYPNRFRAVVMHSGVAPGAAKSSATALGAMRGKNVPPMPTTAVGKAMGAAAVFATLPPMLVLHGDADAVVAPSNAVSSAAVWATALGARPGMPRAMQRGKRRAMQVTDFKRKGRTLVTLCEIAGLGHSWSGGAAKLLFSDPEGPDATRMAWAFASTQFKAAAKA
ncbi:esterase, PHB depolymerase family [Variovorax sp. OK605]|jgi:poly(hydroxyalkanoate) depolymerase family esterase|uniref:extracellular catalytic domain type 1 short-chain-length polyhydroxyalkanoate depolymerase n=1 Tax=unclassified Variovorax TaxID=663243 RepID=UPI0008BD189A|nr:MULTISPECIES: PHB depolymerase family esterase [unclassified Variovorax]SEK17080.1 esterase, PHB depolymerase family [Variovorax sp. OK202]SFE70990.1 esterase, PHB depolymerase family [Variovorax sp. OK212]SFQ51680.1 esterase, PHB depolymerase family [Variovorax sp. OK605]